MARAVTFTLDHWDEMQNEVFNVGQDSMNYTKEDIIKLLQQKLDFLVHFAEVGSDADKRDYAVSYAKINRLGFFTEVDIHRGTDELIAGLRLVDFRRPYSNV
jgi:nucleoside-diphosphate-sugar epimerase